MGDLKGSYPLQSYEDRLQTFADWPSSAPIGRESLARAGFIYEGTEVSVQCFICRVKCDNWNFGDTAIRRHKELRPDCPFVQDNTDVLTDGSSMIVDPQMVIPPPISLANMYNTQVDHGRGQPNVTTKPLSSTAPEFHRIWPNYESMNKESVRVKTFKDWPVTFIRPEDMARAGFVYLKQKDKVQCVFCNGIVAEWEPNDNPFQDHLRHFPRCPFIRGLKCNNISIEDELRGVSAKPLEQYHREYDQCGHGESLNIESFEPERSPERLYPRSPKGNALEMFNVIAHEPSKYPNYATRDARRDSFNLWPANTPQDVCALTEAGFFYTGITDSVKCFQCGGGLKNWEASDVPWEEHARWFPDCQYVVLNKGRQYVETSKKNKPPLLSTSENEFPTEELPSTSDRPWDIREEELEELMREDIVKSVLELGINSDKVKKALGIRIRKAGYPFPDSEALANAALEIPDEAINVEEMPEVEVKDTPLTESQGEAANSNKSGLCATTSRSHNTRDDDLRLCKVCMDREINVVFLPCGHFMACVDCATVMDKCPICRTKIKGHVKTYWP